MNNLKILSLDFDRLVPFCLSKKQSRKISDKRFDIIFIGFLMKMDLMFCYYREKRLW